MFDIDNIKKAKELLWVYCEKCKHHNENGCTKKDGTCEVDEAWSYLDVIDE